MPTKPLLHEVALVSQHTSLTDPAWQYRGCGIAALKMIMDYWHAADEANLSPSANELLQTGLELGAYMDNVGWTHAGLINIARKYGYDGFNIDLPKEDQEIVWEQLLSDLDNQPIMVSVYSNYDPARGGGHIAVLSGMEDDEVILNDPGESGASGDTKTLSVETFLKAWKQRYIVIYPKN